jgi:hypothetical protein
MKPNLPIEAMGKQSQANVNREMEKGSESKHLLLNTA